MRGDHTLIPHLKLTALDLAAGCSSAGNGQNLDSAMHDFVGVSQSHATSKVERVGAGKQSWCTGRHAQVFNLSINSSGNRDTGGGKDREMRVL